MESLVHFVDSRWGGIAASGQLRVMMLCGSAFGFADNHTGAARQALNLFHIIYEEKAASESSTSHAKLCSIINTATAISPSLSDEDKSAVIEAELSAAEEFVACHPILSTSPLDLQRSGITVSDYLGENKNKDEKSGEGNTWTSQEVELWKEYYDVSDV